MLPLLSFLILILLVTVILLRVLKQYQRGISRSIRENLVARQYLLDTIGMDRGPDVHRDSPLHPDADPLPSPADGPSAVGSPDEAPGPDDLPGGIASRNEPGTRDPPPNGPLGGDPHALAGEKPIIRKENR